ncbi:hypothetical protein BROUX41_004783 [Berkeleyomyces rouxiae]|uniref:uncharacterized protein n=1 Tax=Berkeleyomyces rouxiae TaxID=2035830 RepID=UPI003B7FD298
MPRDDLSIDFVKKMPQTEPMDPALILDEWFNRVQNLPEEVRFIQDEVADKDRQYAECIRIAEDRDGKIQKWIKNQGSHEPNPREEQLRNQVRENYAHAEKLAAEKVALTTRLQTIMDKHLRSLDVQIKLLYDRAEPGFLEPNEVPSLLRPSPANKAVPNLSLRNPNNLAALGASPASTIAPAGGTPHTPVTARASTTQIRNAQASHQHAASAPVSPAASIILNRNQREVSAGAASQKRPRLSTGVNNNVVPTSSLARHSSLGPGTPKSIAGTAITAGVTGSAVRAGSAGPRVNSVKAATTTASGRKSNTPTTGTGAGRKRTADAAGNSKSSLSRVRKSTKTSPASTGDSELSDADSGSDMSENDGPDPANSTAASAGTTTTTTHGGAAAASGPHSGSGASARSASNAAGTNSPASATGVQTSSTANGDAANPAGAGTNGPAHGGLAGAADADEDEEIGDYDEASDNKKYCLCQKVSFGDMVACDNDDCPYEWFHWSCVGLVSEPNGKWYCPMCEAKRRK